MVVLVAMNLHCLIHGEVQKKIFIVKIKKTENVSILKEVIKQKNAPHLDHIAPNDLVLWKPKVDLREDELRTEPVHLDFLDTSSYLELSPPHKKLSFFFTGDHLDDECLHIIVEAPGTVVRRYNLFLGTASNTVIPREVTALDATQHLFSLNCLIIGDASDPKNVFTVKIEKTENVSILKDVIKQKNAPHLDHIAPSDLDLFLASSVPKDGDIKAIQPLENLLSLSEVFDRVDRKHVHVLVRKPTNGELIWAGINNLIDVVQRDGRREKKRSDQCSE
jgi:Crinkler effector protein N-terminal domain